jgi:hemolysin activation/secretion protein
MARETEKEMAIPTGLQSDGRHRGRRGSISRFRFIGGFFLIIFVWMGSGFSRALLAADATSDDEKGPILAVSGVEARYSAAAAVRKELLPPIGDVQGVEVELGTIERGGNLVYVKASGGEEIEGGGVTGIPLANIGSLPGHRFTPSAMQAISEAITKYMNSRGIAGVYVEPAGADVAAAEYTPLHAPVVVHFDIHVAVVRRVRTVETGDYFAGTDSQGHGKIDNAFDAGILDHSPVQPTTQDIMHQGAVDDYVLLLNRQPGRQVEATLESEDGPDSVGLNYLVSRSKPWNIYGQVSNTGTKETNVWQERVGLIDNQLTGNDDTLSIDYSTASFDSQNDVNVSYDKPFLGLPWTRGRVYFGYDQFNASDLGDANVNFHGDTTTVGAQISQNIFQYHQLFMDVIVGTRFDAIHVDNTTTDIDGRGNFVMPYVTLHTERTVPIDSISLDLTDMGSLTDANQATRDALGRVNAAQDALIFQGDLNYSLFLEPLFDPKGYEAGKSTLANECYFSLKGQYSFDQRLIAEEQYVEGGLYTVRGYPQSIVAGDSAWVGTAEYRLHVPRVFAVQPQEGELFGDPFRWAPQQPYGRPDWDLILRAFVDSGEVFNASQESFETNATLVGVGVGAELQFRDNMDIRVDYGDALTPIKDAQTGQALVNQGSTQVSVVFTLKL